jgi:GINS complex subunit 1
MSREEFDFFKKYSENLGKYMSHFRNLDLSTVRLFLFPARLVVNLMHLQDVVPPKDLFIQCRVLYDAGTVMTAEGPLDLRSNCIVSLRRESAEPWIRKGVMEQM